MPVSESDKMEVSTFDCRANEKAEHLPIKKRRFLFRTSSPPLNTASSEGSERVVACLESSSQEVQPKPDAPCPPAASLKVAETCQSGSINSKTDGETFVKVSEDDDICGVSLVAPAACSNGPGDDADLCEGSRTVSYGMEGLEGSDTVKFNANSVKPANICAEETDLHLLTAPSKDVASPDKAATDNSTPGESTLENSCSRSPSESECSRINQVTTKTHKSAARDDRFNWDLNTVMDAWEEPLECDHDVDVACSDITYAEGKDSCKEGNSKGCEQGWEYGSGSENIGKEILPVELKSLAHTFDESEQEERKQDCNYIDKLLSPVICSAPHVAVNLIKSLHDHHIDGSSDAMPVAVPSTIKLEYPACDVSAKHVNDDCKSIDDLSCSMAAGSKFSLDYSMPPGFDHCINTRPSEENVVSSTIFGSGNNVNHAITTVQTTESEKLHLSLVTAASLENGVHRTFDEDDKAEIKRAIIRNGISMENLIGKGTESSQDAHGGDCKEVDQTTFGSSLVIQPSVLAEGEDHAASASPIRDKAEVKRAITSNRVITENLIGKGTESSQDAYERDCIELNHTTFGSVRVIQSSVLAEGGDHPVAVSSIHDVCSDAEVPLTATSGMTQLTGTMYHISHELHTDSPNDLVSYNKEVCEVPLDNGYGYEKFPRDIQAGSEVDNVDELSFGYDSQFEDGELRESSIQTWEGYEGDDRETAHDNDNRGTSLHLSTFGARENGSPCLPDSRVRSTDVGPQREADEISSVLLPEKLDSGDQVSGSGPNETRNGTSEVSTKDASQSDQWKMNVSGLDLLPENHGSSNDVTKMRDFSSIKFSSRIGRFGSEIEDMETKAEGSRFYRREPSSRFGEPSTRSAYFNRGRFRMQGCSSINAESSTSRSVRASDVMRTLRRGKYPSHVPVSVRGGGTWNRSPGRGRDLNHLHSPPYSGPSFRGSLLEDVASVDNLTNEVDIDPNDDGRPVASSYITRQSFRNRLLANREEDDFRARLGLRPSGDTYHNRSANVSRGRSLRYGSRHNGGGPRGRYYGPASDDYDEPSMEYSHSFPSRRRCFSPPTERRDNHPRPHGSTSPPRSRTRTSISDGFRRRTSRSPNFHSDTRMRRPGCLNSRHGFEADHVRECNLEPRNSPSPPGSRWVKYRQRSSAFDRRSPPPGRIDPPIGERLNFYDSARKTKQNENYRSERFSELHAAGRGGLRYLGSDGDHGFRRGGFVRRNDMARSVKHFQYDDEDGYGPVYDSREKETMEFHGRGNPKPYGNGTRGVQKPDQLDQPNSKKLKKTQAEA